MKLIHEVTEDTSELQLETLDQGSKGGSGKEVGR